jgi:hypothetical protein
MSRNRIGTAVADDDQPIIQIAGMADGRQHDAAGVDTGEHQRVDAVGAQQCLEVGANEGADAVLDHDRFPRSRRRGRMDRGALASRRQHSVCLHRAKSGVAGADLGMTGPERDDDMEHHHAHFSRGGDQLRHARDRIGGLRSRHELVEDIDLIIHHQQRVASRIDVRKLRHGFLRADDEFSYDVSRACSLSISGGSLCPTPFESRPATGGD